MELPQILVIAVFIKSLYIMVLRQIEKQLGYVRKLYTQKVLKGVKPHKLIRWVYVSQGPNFMWHIDGYDKLTLFGFPIHRATDSFIRKILWLNICPSNNDPYIISYFYVNCISNLKCVLRTIRGHRGSENVAVAGMQWYFSGEHQDTMSGHSGFLFGSSKYNQRIE